MPKLAMYLSACYVYLALVYLAFWLRQEPFFRPDFTRGGPARIALFMAVWPLSLLEYAALAIRHRGMQSAGVIRRMFLHMALHAAACAAAYLVVF